MTTTKRTSLTGVGGSSGTTASAGLNKQLVATTSSNSNNTTQQEQQIKYTCGGSFTCKPLLIDNENLIVTSVSQTIKIYSNNTGKQLNEIVHHKKKITQIIKDYANENQMFSVSEDGNVCLWRINIDTNTYSLVKEISISKPIYGIQQDVQNHELLYLCIHEHFYSIIKLNVETKVIEYNLFQMLNFTQMILSNYLFIIGGVDLYIYNLKKQEIESTITNQGSNLTCMTFCSENQTLATGDGHGVISLWFSDGTRSSHHWHPSMVTSLQFSEEGDYLYSSGIEGVVVCWRLPSLKKDKFLVTDTNISNFVLSSNQDDILILGKDNIIRKYEFARFNLIYRIYGINTNLDSINNNNIAVTNEPNSDYILMNGTSSLQWFNINDSSVKHYECIQFRDVKYDPSRFNDSKPVKTVIDKLAFNQFGNLLAHVESFGNLKQNLKFWKLSGNSTGNEEVDGASASGGSKKVKPKLITVIDTPHSDKVTQLLFNPAKQNSTTQCLTSSLDGKIRVWNLKNDLFSCHAILEYKNLPCYSFDISQDGTLLCAVFGCEITLWDLERFELIESHNYPYQLLDCKFINDDYIAIISDRYISLFSLLFDNKNIWTIDAGHVQSLVTNVSNGTFACIVNGSEVIQFNLSNDVVHSHPLLDYHLDTDHFLQTIFYKNNQLYFLNKQFEIYKVIGASKSKNTTVSSAAFAAVSATVGSDIENSTATTAPSSIYEKKWISPTSSTGSSSGERISLMELQRVNTVPFSTDIGNRAWKEIFSAPSHSLISMSSSYSTYMNTFILKSLKNQSTTSTNSNDDGNNTNLNQYATLVPSMNQQHGNNNSASVEDNCVPCADLIRFINTYSK